MQTLRFLIWPDFEFLPLSVSNKAGFLQNTSRHCNVGPACAQYVGQKFLCERHNLAAETILRHQKPPGQPFVDLMKAIASGYLE
jgi:hypothetical protein